MLSVNPSTGELIIQFRSPAVSSVAGRTGHVVLTSADVGLPLVNNTSDANKPISNATQTALNAKADLVGGVIPTAQIPALAVTDYLGIAANQAAMLALSGQKGDWAIRSDTGSTWVISGNDPTQLASWTSISYPGAPVTSVNGQVGAVTLSWADVGAQQNDADLTSWAAIVRASGFDAFVASPSSANLAALVTGKTGTGPLVFATSPTLITPNIGAATGTSISLTGSSTAIHRDKGGLVFDVRAYGAVGNGIADDLAAFQAADAALTAAGGGRLYVPSGNYRWSTGFTFSGLGKSMEGASADSTVITVDAAAPYCLRLGAVGALFSAIISNIRLTRAGAWPPAAGTIGVDAQYFTNFHMRDVQISMHDIGIKTDNNSLGLYAHRIAIFDCGTRYLWIKDGIEIFVSFSNFGLNGSSTGPTESFILVDGTTNDIRLQHCQMIDRSVTATPAVFKVVNTGPAPVGYYRLTDVNVENAVTLLLTSDATAVGIPDLYVMNSRLGVDTLASLHASTVVSNARFIGNAIATSTPTTLASWSRSVFSGNSFGGSTVTFSGGNALVVEGNTSHIGLTFSGAHTGTIVSENVFAAGGTLSVTGTGITRLNNTYESGTSPGSFLNSPFEITTTTATPPSYVLSRSGSTIKSRMFSAVTNWTGISDNMAFTGTEWHLDDTTRPGWTLKLDGRAGFDYAVLLRASAGANPRTPTDLFAFFPHGGANFSGTADPGAGDLQIGGLFKGTGATLSGLTANGIVRTTGGTGALSVRTTAISARVFNSDPIPTANAADTYLTFNSERWDTDGIHDSFTNSGRLTCVTPGKYMITGNVRFTLNGTGVRVAIITLNAAREPIAARSSVANTSFGHNLTVTTVYDMAAGDYVELAVSQTSGGVLNVESFPKFSPEFSMTLIS